MVIAIVNLSSKNVFQDANLVADTILILPHFVIDIFPIIVDVRA